MPRRKLLLTQEQVDQNLRVADRLEALLTFSAERERAKRRIQELLLVFGVETDRYDLRDFLRKVYVVGRDKCGWPPLPEDGGLFPALWNNPKYEWRDAISDLESAAALQNGANLVARRKDANNPLKRLRLEADLSQEELANRAGIDPSLVKRIETGKVKRPNKNTRSDLSTVLSAALHRNITPADLLAKEH